MLLIALLACGEKEEDTGTTVEEVVDRTGLVVTVEPSTIDFGMVDLGGSSERAVTVKNKGDTLVLLTQMEVANIDLTIDAGGAFAVEPGQTLDLNVIWSPTIAGVIDDTLTVSAGETPDATETWLTTISGLARGPELVLPKANVELGEVAVGCHKEDTLRLVNTGTSDLEVKSINLSGSSEWSIWTTEGLPISGLPWDIKANQMEQFVVRYQPSGRHLSNAGIEVTTDDPLRPEAQIVIGGSGIIDNDNEMSWTIRENQNVTIIMHVNEIAITQYNRTQFEDALPTFFGILQESGVHWRMNAMLHENGESFGGPDYIDHTYDTDDAIESLFDMLEGGSSQYGDNDSNLQTIANAVTVNQSWLIDESLEWEESKLNLIAVNDDADQSANNYQTYLNTWYALKTRNEDVQVHAIAGANTTSQQGCYAVYFGGYWDAVSATGGQKLDVCETDWTAHMEALGNAVLGENNPTFELEGTPSVESIEVRVDGLLWPNGWTYDYESNAVSFEEGSYPDEGSALTIYYLYTPDCSVYQ
jgi:hypothetical protein